jgi:hypothetical protein
LRDTIAAFDRCVASMVAATRSSDAIARAIADPKLDETLLGHLDRNVNQGQNRQVAEDAEGNVTIGFVDKELAELDAQSAAAKEIAACVRPHAAAE